MPLWDPKLPEWPTGNFSTIAVEEVLVTYNGPITFTFRDVVGALMLAHLCDDNDDGVMRYVVAPTSPEIIANLKGGGVSVRVALDQPLVWLLDLSRGALVRGWALSPSQIPQDALPSREVMLRPGLQPLIRTRAVGSAIRAGSIPADAIRTLVAGAESAIGTLIDFVTGQGVRTGGEDDVRYPYELNATHLAFGSIEVSFEARRAKDESPVPVADAVLTRVEELLARGLRWGQAGGGILEASSVEEEAAIMEAVRQLSPKRGGDADYVEISGRVAAKSRQSRVTLTNTMRQLAAERLRTLRQHDPQPITMILHGRVGEIDYDRNTALYRDFRIISPKETANVTVLHGDEVKLVFTPDQLDDVAEVADLKSRMVGEAHANASAIQLATIRLLREHESPEEL